MGGSPRLRASLRDLTPRQREVLERISAGRTNYDIAQELGISLEGVKYHVSEILARLDVTSREEAAALWRGERRPLARFGRVLAPLAALGLRGALLAGAAVVLGVAGLVLVLLALRDDEPGDAAVQATETPTPGTGNQGIIPASCPVATPRQVRPALAPLSGDGPVYAMLIAPNHPGKAIVEYGQSLGGPRQLWGAQKFIVALDPASPGDVTIRGRRLDGTGEVRFGDVLASEYVLRMLVPPGSPNPLPTDTTTWVQQSDGWYEFLTSIRIQVASPGCYTLDVEGPGSNRQQIVFWAITDASAQPSMVDNRPPASCPAEASRIVHDAFPPAIGAGPVYVGLGAPALHGQRTLLYHPPGRYDGYAQGWGGEDLQFIVDPAYTDAIRISLRRLEGSGDPEFLGPSEWVLLPPAGPLDTGWPVLSAAVDGWRGYVTNFTLPLGAAGCFELAFTGPGLDERVVFWAQQDPATTGGAPTPTPTPGASPPLCQSIPPGQPRPPIDWIPFVRWAGREYQLLGGGLLGPGRPLLAADPAMAANALGTVRWNVRDVDPCYSQYEGSSAALEAGTVLYAMSRYAVGFRIMAETPYGWRIFEAYGVGDAKTAADILDIRGKVRAFDVGAWDPMDGEPDRWSRIARGEDVVRWVDRLLDEPIVYSPDIPMFQEPQAVVVFHLSDGTTVRRNWYAGPQEYAGGIPVAEAFVAELLAFAAGP